MAHWNRLTHAETQISALEAELERVGKHLERDRERYAENFELFAFEDGAPIRNHLMDMYEQRIKQNEQRIEEVKERLKQAQKQKLIVLKGLADGRIRKDGT